MVIKLFVLGRPGSGKTSAARYIASCVRDIARESLGEPLGDVHLDDYGILQEMCYTDTSHQKFCPKEYNGFDVLDFSVLDTALQIIEAESQKKIGAIEQNILLTIEFARDDYQKALKQFSTAFLQDSYFLFLQTHIDTCLQHIHERVAKHVSADDHPSLSDDRFRDYYANDITPDIIPALEMAFSIAEEQVTLLENMGSFGEFQKKLENYVCSKLQRAVVSKQEVAVPQEHAEPTFAGV